MSRARHFLQLLLGAIVAASLSSGVAGSHASRTVVTLSNILPEDYTGPGSCRDCHEAPYELWSKHPHARMNAEPGPDTVRADFGGRRVPVPGGTAVFSTEGGSYFVSLERDGRRVRRYRVTRVVGSRFMQFFIGRAVEGPDLATEGDAEVKLPYGYSFRFRRWFLETYFDPGPPELDAEGRPTLDPFTTPPSLTWRESCVPCHDTFPYLFRIASPEQAGYPRGDLRVEPAPLSAALAKAGEAASHTTLGVSCESCHFGGRAHAQGALAKPTFGPSSSLVRVLPRNERDDPTPSRKNPYSINSICGQCHSSVAAQFPNGASTWNSREAADLASGACAGAIRCTDCHDPHRASGPEAASDSHLASVCVRCHDRFSDEPAARAHSGHAASDACCLDCHMPRISQGLEEVVRSHRISSPADVRMLATASPNACNLCHLDRSIRWTLDSIERGWGRRIEPAPAWARAYGGGLDAPVGKVWLASADHAVRLAATQAFARSPLGRGALPELLSALEEPVPVNRVFAQVAVERVTGEPLGNAYDVQASPGERHAQVNALRSRWRAGAR